LASFSTYYQCGLSGIIVLGHEGIGIIRLGLSSCLQNVHVDVFLPFGEPPILIPARLVHSGFEVSLNLIWHRGRGPPTILAADGP
jgi:hypothetical protein